MMPPGDAVYATNTTIPNSQQINPSRPYGNPPIQKEYYQQGKNNQNLTNYTQNQTYNNYQNRQEPNMPVNIYMDPPSSQNFYNQQTMYPNDQNYIKNNYEATNQQMGYYSSGNQEQNMYPQYQPPQNNQYP